MALVTYSHDWRSAPRESARTTTAADGAARIATDPSRGGRFFVLARRGDDLALLDLQGWWGRRDGGSEGSRTLVFTDRSLYRPGQTLRWKVLAFAGRAAEGGSRSSRRRW